MDSSIDEALVRLECALLRGRIRTDSFSADTVPEPEQRLFDAIAALRDDVEHFAAPSERPPGDAQLGSFARLLDNLTTAAKVETRVDGQVVASTWVGLAGDVTASLGREASAGQLDQHVRELTDILGAQRARMQLLLAILQATAKIAVAVGTGNPLTALPAAWDFIQAVLAESRARTPE